MQGGIGSHIWSQTFSEAVSGFKDDNMDVFERTHSLSSGVLLPPLLNI